MHPKTRSLIDRPQIGQGRSLAIGAGNMNDRRKGKVRIAQLFKQSGNPPQRKVDDFRVQLAEASKDCVAARQVIYPHSEFWIWSISPWHP